MSGAKSPLDHYLSLASGDQVLPIRAAKRTADTASRPATPAELKSRVDAAQPKPILGARLSTLVPTIVEKSTLPLVSTGLPTLDARIGGGLEMHSISIIVAGVGKGKSSLALQIAASHARTSPVVYYAGEMALYRIAARAIGQRTGRSWSDVLRARISTEEMTAAIADLNLYVVPRQADPIAAIDGTLAHISSVDRIPGTPMIVIDYIQLVADIAKDQRLSTMDAVRRLRAYVEAHQVVCLALSQSSRGGAERIREGTEHAEELVGTGAETAELEASASNVLVLSYTGQDGAEVHDVTLAIAKARDGGTSKLGLRYNGRTGVWTESGLIKLPAREQARRDAILHQIDTHHGQRCISGSHFCAQDLSANAFTASGGPHKVVGERRTVFATLRDMEHEGVIVRAGNDYRRTSDTPGAPLYQYK